MRWDVFCRVIDNWGDIGVCWRLAAQLAAGGDTVRLWIDDPIALTWMAPGGAKGVTALHWSGDTQWPEPGDVVIEAFGCELPRAFVRQMAAGHARPPAWINLEYLSAEDYVARNHLLVSPQMGGADAGLRKQFFYPGFTVATGGLLREPDLLARQSRFDAIAWRAAHGLQAAEGERIISLFCYEHAPLAPLIDALQAEPTLLAVTYGAASQLAIKTLGPTLRIGSVRAVLVPALPQPEFDHLLWSSDLNFVRGEDSLVRALWAGRPFIWQIYPQTDGVHAKKLHAFNTLYLKGAKFSEADDYSTLSNAWNGLSAGIPRLPGMANWQFHAVRWREQLLRQTDLVTQLRALATVTG
ncbi:MAG: elongation factor P maturation arginine rhamnosyltransferase EarP [Betaproteobacteria bacterium]|nr:elongation factor P maturation arginine rhamnosyltransferase EarP [Betaproteobacteria bacterium]